MSNGRLPAVKPCDPGSHLKHVLLERHWGQSQVKILLFPPLNTAEALRNNYLYGISSVRDVQTDERLYEVEPLWSKLLGRLTCRRAQNQGAHSPEGRVGPDQTHRDDDINAE